MAKADAGISCHHAGIFGDLYFSTKILEYLSQNLAVVTPRTRTISRYLPDDCVFYFEPNDANSFADAIRLMWHCPDEVLRRLHRSHQMLSRLSWPVEKENLVTFYSELLQSHQGPHKQRHAIDRIEDSPNVQK
jgi:glycosyltransferase involved in cell wall biosynthesis